MDYAVKNLSQKLSPGQKELAKRLRISERFLSLLLARGIDESEIEGYLHPSLDGLSSPFAIKGMKEAAERVKKAIRGGEKILIYGDYDCDGICAISILMLYLRDKADVWYFIPDRNRDGYGMSVSALERMFAAKRPSLVITVDCGITAVGEVEYIKSQGIDVIVTDHHEPQDVLPNCLIVDPKLEREGFFELCGAGVAFKLVEALSNAEEARKYIDIAAIATIADVVPLVKDNRIIAYFGLKALLTSPRRGIKLLVGAEDITSQDIMFKLAPRINAAGRLGSAMKAVGLFLESDYFMLKTLAEELARDNARRQDMCEVIVEEAKSMLKGVDFDSTGFIALYNENWEAGILGIAAARIVDEFKRPAVLFAKNGEELKGSARSVPCVNIFELFSGMSEYYTSFGGHAQAAGISIRPENFEAFREEANRRVLSEHPLTDFIPPVECEMELTRDIDFLSFAKELEYMEPTGYKNPKPTFLIKDGDFDFERIGFSQHVKYSGKNLDILGFSRYPEALGYKSGKLDIEVSLGVNTFQNNVTAQALIRSFKLSELTLEDSAADCLNVHQLDFEGTPRISSIDAITIKETLKKPFGTLFVCFRRADVDRLKSICPEVESLPVYVGGMPSLNPENAVLVCPCSVFEFGFYAQVVIAGDPLSKGYVAHISKSAKCYALDGVTINAPHISDDTLRAIYRELAAQSRRTDRASNMRKLYLSICSRYKVSEQTFLIAIRIFEQLGLLSISERGQLSVANKRVKLDDSAVYRNLRH